MANLIYGENVYTFLDVQNLVVSVILRLETSYTKDDLINKIKDYMKGSKLLVSDIKLSRIIEDVLDILQRYDLVICSNGKYTTINTNYILAKHHLKDIDENKQGL